MNQYLDFDNPYSLQALGRLKCDFDNPYSLQALGRYKNEKKEFLNKKQNIGLVNEGR